MQCVLGSSLHHIDACQTQWGEYNALDKNIILWLLLFDYMTTKFINSNLTY
jgi:hypothetical protein